MTPRQLRDKQKAHVETVLAGHERFTQFYAIMKKWNRERAKGVWNERQERGKREFPQRPLTENRLVRTPIKNSEGEIAWAWRPEPKVNVESEPGKLSGMLKGRKRTRFTAAPRARA